MAVQSVSTTDGNRHPPMATARPIPVEHPVMATTLPGSNLDARAMVPYLCKGSGEWYQLC